MTKWIVYCVHTVWSGSKLVKHRKPMIGTLCDLYQNGSKIGIGQVCNNKVVAILKEEDIVRLLVPTTNLKF